jgi:hypothetical protein
VRKEFVRTRGRSAVTATLPKNFRRERRPIGLLFLSTMLAG